MEKKNIEENSENVCVFEQLVDMFSEILTSDIILDVCVKQKWEVENCIQDLIRYIERSPQGLNTITQNHNDELSKDLELNTQDNVADIVEYRKISAISDSNLCTNISTQSKNLGAIPKSASSVAKLCHSSVMPTSTKAKSSLHTNLQESESAPNQRDDEVEQGAVVSQQVKRIIKAIQEGYRIMVIMRGAPGCGKSYLARYIVDQTVGNDYRNHIFSSDDYFYNVYDQYLYKSEKIQEAHDYNQKRVRKKAAEGWSPIIVDNTNIKIWEMSPYVQTAVQHGFIIEILQPDNAWCHSASKLFAKNKHGVPRENIERMLKNFEPISVDELIKINNLKYSVQIPLLRHYPALDNSYQPEINPSVTSKVDAEILEKSDVQTTLERKKQNENTIRDAESVKFLINNDCFEKSNPSVSEYAHTSIPIPKKPNLELEKVGESSGTKIEMSQDMNLFHQSTRFSNEESYNTSSADVWTDYSGTPKSCVEEKLNIFNIQNTSKPARNSPKFYRENNATSFKESLDNNLPGMKDSDWKSYEEESSEFWATNRYSVVNVDQQTKELDRISSLSKPKRDSNRIIRDSINLYSLSKNEVKDIGSTNRTVEYTSMPSNKLERHKLGCPNESKSFLMLRQIYQNKQLDGLWDLFEKCNGDVNWAIDILLKDDSCIDQQIPDKINVEDCFKCRCEDSQNKLLKYNQDKECSPSDKSSRYKTKKEKVNLLSPEMLEAKRAIEKQIVLGEEYYSNNIKKIRKFRHGMDINYPSALSASTTTVDSFHQDGIQYVEESEDKNNDEDNISDAEFEDMIEVDLGKELIKQLESTFNTYSSPRYSFSDFKTKVFMPKSLAKQLYVLWIESLYNQMEEQKQNAIKDDEELARFLQNSGNCIKFSDAPENFKDIMDMDLAWSLYKSDTQNWKNSTPKDLASYLTRLKLYDLFPNIDKDTLLEILIAHDNRFSDTVEVLKDSLKGNIDEEIQLKGIHLLNQVNDANEKNMMESENQTMEYKGLKPRFAEVKAGSEEAKKLALRDFEESRNLAVHHSQLKAECYRKAKEAIQKGHHAVAVYYSQIANLHKIKIEKYNQKAASCIMELQNLNQSNPDFIDLHYLHVIEAVECLDVFIDRHITKLKNICRNYKFIFIITGRGLHSTGGVSAIKNKVKTRLKERNLTWSEVNPGLLKVKIFSTSKYSKNS